MLRNWLISIFLVLGLTFAFAPPALAAVNCNFKACMNHCGKVKGGNALQRCTTWCQQTIGDRQRAGQCK